MEILNKINLTTLLLLFVPFVLLTASFFIAPQKVFAATSRVDLLTADNFAVLAGSALTSTPPATIIGNVGLSPASGSFYTGLTALEVTGTIYAVDSSGPGGSINNPGLLTTAKNDLTTAYNDAAGRSPTTTFVASDNQLGGQTLTSGVYAFGHASSANITAANPLTLDAQGDPNAVFIFQASSDFITASGSVVQLVNGAQACNVYWQVTSSATIGTGSTLVGNILALSSITDNGGSTINGRLLARNAATTLNNTTVRRQTCITSGSNSGSGSNSNTNSNSGGSTNFCPALNNVTPNIIESKRIDADSVFIKWAPYSGTDKFIVQYGLEDGKWLYSTNVTGFSITLNALPSDQPIWIRAAVRNDCSIGTYGPAKLVGGPSLPSTGITSDENNIFWYFPMGIIILTVFFLRLKHR